MSWQEGTQMKVDNAIIMAAGTASRFAPLSYEKPKALIEVRGEVLIERQIRQLREAGVDEIIIVTGYMVEQFEYLKDKYGVEEDGSTLSVYLSREDMACLSNMTTSNAIRTLSAFATENLIAIDGRKIKIIDDSKLRKISTIG